MNLFVYSFLLFYFNSSIILDQPLNVTNKVYAVYFSFKDTPNLRTYVFYVSPGILCPLFFYFSRVVTNYFY